MQVTTVHICDFYTLVCQQCTNTSSSDTFCVPISCRDRVSECEIRDLGEQRKTLSVYTVYSGVSQSAPFVIKTIGSFRVSLRAERPKCFLLTWPTASSFRVWSISWRPSLWRISSPTGVSCTKGSWCSQVGTDSNVICSRSCDTSKDLTLFFFGSLLENTKLIDVYLFLFDEFLLITKIKRNKKVRCCSQPELDRVQVCRDASVRVHSVCVCVCVCVCAVFLCSGPWVQIRILWGCRRTWSWISCWRRGARSQFWTSPSLWTGSSWGTLISSTPQVTI